MPLFRCDNGRRFRCYTYSNDPTAIMLLFVVMVDVVGTLLSSCYRERRYPCYFIQGHSRADALIFPAVDVGADHYTAVRAGADLHMWTLTYICKF